MKKIYLISILVFVLIIASVGSVSLAYADSHKVEEGNYALSDSSSNDGVVPYAVTATPTIYWYIGGGELVFSSNSALPVPEGLTSWSNKSSFTNATSNNWTGDNSSSRPGWNSSSNNITSIRFADEIVPTNLNAWFYGLSKVTSIDFTNLKTSLVTSCYRTFYGMTTIPEIDISNLDLSACTRFEQMFYNCQNVTRIITQTGNSKTSKWRNGTSFRYMFYDCYNLQEVDMTAFGPTAATDISYMFSGATTKNLASIDLSNFQIASGATVTNIISSSNTYLLSEVKFSKSIAIILTNSSFSAPTNFSPWFFQDENTAFTSGTNLGTWAVDYFNKNKSATSITVFHPYTTTCYYALEDGVLTISSDEFEGSTSFNTRTDRSATPFSGCTTATSVKFKGKVVPGSMGGWFRDFTALKSIDYTNLETKYTSYFNYTFYNTGLEKLDLSSLKFTAAINCSNMIALNPNLVSLNLKGNSFPSLTNGSNMFRENVVLKQIDVSDMVAPNATDLQYMFYRDYAIKNLDLSKLNTPKLTNFQYMFNSMTELEFLDISSIDVSKVSFSSSSYYQSVFGGHNCLRDIRISESLSQNSIMNKYGFGNKNPSNVNPWYYVTGSTEANKEFDEIDVAKLQDQEKTSMSRFDQAGRYINIISPYVYWGFFASNGELVLSDEPVASATYSGSYVGYGSPSYIYLSAEGTNVTLAKTDVKSARVQGKITVGTISGMFSGYTALTSVDLTGMNTVCVKNFSNIFLGCTVLSDVNVNSLDTRFATNLSCVFQNCYALETVDVTNWSVGNATTLSSIFGGCSMLKNLDLSTWAPTKTTSFSSMFYNCSVLESIDFGSGFKTSSATNFASMFMNCKSLKTLNLSTFVTATVTDYSNMFRDCASLERLDTSNFDMGKASNVSYMYYGLTNVKSLNVSSFSTGTINMSSNSNANQSAFYGFYFLEEIFISQSLADQFKVGKWDLYNRTPSSTCPWYFVTGSKQETTAVDKIDVADLQDRERQSIKSFTEPGRYINIITPYVYWGFFEDTGALVLSDQPVEGEGLTCSGRYQGQTQPSFTYTANDVSVALDKTLVKSVSVKGKITIGTMVSMFNSYPSLESVDFTGINSICVKTMASMFASCAALVNVNINTLDTRFVTTMSGAFSNCRMLKVLDLSNWRVENVTNFSSTFYACSELQKLDISSWVPEKATNFSSMFAGNPELVSIYVGDNFMTSSATTFASMFAGCKKLKDLDTSKFFVEKVTDFSNMFKECLSLEMLDLSNFKTSSATNFSYMFYTCSSLRELDLSSFDTSKVTSISYMLYGLTNVQKMDLTNFSFAKINFSNSSYYNSFMGGYQRLQEFIASDELAEKFAAGTFSISSRAPSSSNPWFYVTGTKQEKTAVDKIDVTLLQDQKKTAMKSFDKAGRYVNIITPIIYWGIDDEGVLTLSATERTEGVKGYFMGGDSSSSRWRSTDYIPLVKSVRIDGPVTIGTLTSLFQGLTELVSVDLTGLNTICVTGMASTFSGCTALQSVKLLSLDVRYVTDMGSMFNGCKSLEYVDLSTWKTDSLTNLGSIFSSCTALKTVRFDNFNTSNVTSMSYMFSNCSALESVDLTMFNTTKVSNMGYMFQKCTSLRELDLSSFSTPKVTSFARMFDGCTALEVLDISQWDGSVATSSSAFDGFSNGVNLLKDLTISPWLANNTSKLNSIWSYNKPSSTNYWYFINDKQIDLPVEKIDYLKYETRYTAATQFTTAGRYICPLTTYVYWAVTDGNLVISAKPLEGDVTGSYLGSYNSSSSPFIAQKDNIRTVSVDGKVVIGSLYYYFYGLEHIVSIDLTGLDTGNVTNMSYTFCNNKALKSLNLNSLNVEYVTNFSGTFYNCTSLASLDLSNWVTRSATNMSSMFYGCSSLKQLKFDKFDTKNVTSMGSMFSYCAFDTLDLSVFDTSNVSVFSYMFAYCPNLKGVNLASFVGTKASTLNYMFAYCTKLERVDMSTFETTTALTSLTSMFRECGNLTYINIAKLDVSRATNSSSRDYVFYSTYALKELIISQSMANFFSNGNIYIYNSGTYFPWYYIAEGDENKPLTELTPLTSYRNFTKAGRYITKVDYYVHWAFDEGELVLSATPLTGSQTGKIVGGWSSSSSPWASISNQVTSVRVDGKLSVGSIYYWFYNFLNVKTIDLTNLDTSTARIMSYAFYNCKALTNLTINNLDVSNVENLTCMFQNCTSLKQLDISKWVGIKATSINYMFLGCSSLQEVTFGDFGGTKVTTMYGMFKDCISLKEVDLTGFHPTSVTTTSYMFYNCPLLTSVDLLFDDTKLTSMSYMFYGCTALPSMDLTKINMDTVTTVDYMFYKCSSLKTVDLSKFKAQKLTSMQYWFYHCVSLTTLDLSALEYTVFTTNNSSYYRDAFTSLTALQQIKVGQNLIDKVLKSYSGSVGLTAIISSTAPWYERDAATTTAKITHPNQMKANTWYKNPYTAAIYWFVEDSVLTITSLETAIDGKEVSGTFVGTQSFSSSSMPWYPYKDEIKKVVISGTVTPASTAYWFYNFTTIKTADISGLVTDTTTSIAYMFYGCTSLMYLDISTLNMSTITSYSYFLYNLKTLNTIIINSQQAGKMVNYGFVVQVPMWNNELQADITKAQEMVVAGGYYGGVKVTFTDGKGWTKIVSVSYDGTFDIDSIDFSSLPIPSPDMVNHIMYFGLDKWVYEDGTEVNFDDISGNVTVYATYQYVTFTMPAGELKYNTKKHDISVDNPFDAEYTISYFYNPYAQNGIFEPVDSTVNAGYYYARLKVGTKYVDSAIYHVSPITIYVWGLSAEDKVYDQTVTAVINTDGAIFISKDDADKATLEADKATLKVTASGRFVDANVGTEKTVNITQIETNNPNYVIDLSGSRTETQADISPKDIEGKVQVSGISDRIYTGSGITQNFTVTVEGKRITLGTDYNVVYKNNTDAGVATIEISGIGNYSGIETVTFNIKKKNIGESDVSGSVADATYTGEEITDINIVLKYGQYVLTSSDYQIVSFSNNKNAGTATVVVEAKGKNFEGTKTLSFRINQLSLADCEVVFDGIEKQYLYEGAPVTPQYTLLVNGQELKLGTDYTSTCVNNAKPGTATIRITGRGNYTGIVTKEFEIVALGFEECTITFEYASLPYNGKSQKQEPIIKDKNGEVVDSKNYRLAYSADTINAGTVTVTIIGLNKYLYSQKVVTYEIVAISLSDFEVAEIANQVYNRKAQTPTLKISKDGLTLVYNVDYTVEYLDNIDAGIATVIVTGKGNYYGTTDAQFEIVPATISSASLKVKQVYYNGTAQKPNILTVSAGSFVLNADEYDIEYYVNGGSWYTGDFIDAATITVTIVPKAGNANYEGSASVTYTIRAAIISSVTLEVTQVSFSGSANNPVVASVVASNGYVLKTSDYKLEYYRAGDNGGYNILTSDFTSAGKILVVATPANTNVSSTSSAVFEITKLSIQDSRVTIKYYFVDEHGEEILDDDSQRTYMEEDQFIPGKKVAPEVSFNGQVVSDEYYSFTIIALEGNEDGSYTSIGRYKIVVTGVGSFTGSVEYTYKINPNPFKSENIEIEVNKESFTYNGTAQTFNFDLDDIIVYDISSGDKVRLYLNQHFELANGTVTVQYAGGTNVTLKPKNGYINNINAGTAILVLTGKDGQYSNDVIVVNFTITAREITDCVISEIADVTYNGRLQQPKVTITVPITGETAYTMVQGTDFTVEYEDNLTVGTCFVTIKGINNFTGTTTTNFEINAKDIGDPDIEVSGLDRVSFNGTSQKPTIVIKYKVANGETLILEEDELGDKDYIVIFFPDDFVNPSIVTVYIFGTNNYTGSLELTYEIDKIELTDAYLSDKVYKHQFDGNHYDLLSRVVVTYEYEELQESGTKQKVTGIADKSGYTLYYQKEIEDGVFGELALLTDQVKFVDAGKIRIVVQATESGPYKVSDDLFIDFEITGFTLTADNVLDVESAEFTGRAITPEPTVMFNDTVLRKDIDYTLAYDNNVNAGTQAIIKVIGKGSYKGTVVKYFEITPVDIGFTDIVIVDDEIIYNGRARELNGDNVYFEYDGLTLVYGVDFELMYDALQERIGVGAYRFHAVGKGNYKGTTDQYYFYIVPRDLATIDFGEFDPVTYTGKLVTPVFDLIDNFGDTHMRIGTDVVLSYGDASTNINVAWARRNGQLEVDRQAIVIVSAGPNGNYTGMALIYFAIAPVDLATDERITVDPITDILVLYDEPIRIVPTVRFNGEVLVENTFNYTYVNADQAGQATVSIVAYELTNYVGQRDVYYTILDPNDRPDLANARIENVFEDVEYDGTDHTPDFSQLKVYMGDELLVYGVDYDIEYSSVNGYFVNVGKKEVNIVAMKNGKYKGSQKVSFNILGVGDEIDIYLYLGSESNKLEQWTYNQYDVKQIQLYVSAKSGRTPSIDFYRVNDDGTITIIEGVGEDAGTYFVRAIIQEDGNYREIVVDHYFTINPLPITFSGVTAESKVYDGTRDAIINTNGLKFVGVLEGDEVGLTADMLFEDANAGTNKKVYLTNVQLIGANAGNYTLAETGCQTETTASISKKVITVVLNIPQSNMVYVKVQEVDYDVEGFSQSTAGILRLSFTDQNQNVTYTMPQKVGTYTIAIEFENEIAANNFEFGTGSVLTGQIRISEATITSSNALAIDDQVYTGEALFPEVIIIYEGVILENGEDFDLVYSNNTEVGTASIQVTCKGNFAGSFTLTFKIYKPSIEISNLRQADWTYGDTKIPAPTFDAPVYEQYIIEYSTGPDENGEYLWTDQVPTQAGVYYVKVSSATSPTIFVTCSFRILPKELSATIDVKDYVYGEAITAPGVTFDGVVGNDVISYTLTYVCESLGYRSTVIPTDAGTYTVVITSDNENYTLTASATFEIHVLEAEIVIELDAWMYGEEPNLPTVILMANGIKLEGIELIFSFVYSDSEDGEYTDVVPTKPGTYFVMTTIENDANRIFTQKAVSFEITKRIITITKVTAESKTYDGTTDANVTIAGVSGILAGDTVTITAKGRFSDINAGRNKVVTAYDFELSGDDADYYQISTSAGSRLIATATIEAKKVSVTITIGSNTYTYFDEIEISVSVDDPIEGDENIVALRYRDSHSVLYTTTPVNVGSYTAYVELINSNYVLTNSPEEEFEITPYTITADMASKIPDQVVFDDPVTPDIVITVNGIVLVVHQDFEVVYSANTGAGEAKAHITCKGNYTGEFDLKFTILEISVFIEVEGDEVEFDGQEHDAFSKHSATDKDGQAADGVKWEFYYNGQMSTEMPRFRNVGEYKVYYKVTDSLGKSVGGNGEEDYCITLIIHAVDITDVTVNGYEGIFDGQNHNAVDGEYTCVTVGGEQATWTFSQDDGDVKSYGEMPTFKDAGTHTVYYKITAPNHNDVYGEFTVTIETVKIDGSWKEGKVHPEFVCKNPEHQKQLTVTYYDSGESVVNEEELVPGETYTARITLVDSHNYEFLGEAEIEFEARKKVTLFELIEENKTFKFIYDDRSVVTYSEHTYDPEKAIYLTDIAANDSLADIIAQFVNEEIRVFDKDGNEILADKFASTIVKTAIVLRLYDGEDIVDELTLVLKGDVNGDGRLTTTDISQILGYSKGSLDFEGAYLLAGDVNGDGRLTTTDISQVLGYSKGILELFEGLSVKQSRASAQSDEISSNRAVNNSAQAEATTKQNTVTPQTVASDEVDQQSDLSALWLALCLGVVACVVTKRVTAYLLRR